MSELLELNCTSGDEPCTVMVSATVASAHQQVDGHVAALRHAHRLLRRRAEPLQRRGHGVVARIDEVEPVAPFGIGDAIGRDAGGSRSAA